MSSKALLISLFRFKASIDRELSEALMSFAPQNRSQNFHLALRVLHHAHIVDRIFVANLVGQDHGEQTNWIEAAPDLAELAIAMAQTDQWYLDYVSKISPDELSEFREFTFTDGGHGHMSREEMLAHVITHSGYHRGEVGQLLPEIESTGMRDVFAGFLHRCEPHRRQRNKSDL